MLALVRDGDTLATPSEQWIIDAVASSLAAWDGLALVAAGPSAMTGTTHHVYPSWRRAELDVRSEIAALLVTIEPNGPARRRPLLRWLASPVPGSLVAVHRFRCPADSSLDAVGARIAHAVLRRESGHGSPIIRAQRIRSERCSVSSLGVHASRAGTWPGRSRNSRARRRSIRTLRSPASGRAGSRVAHPGRNGNSRLA